MTDKSSDKYCIYRSDSLQYFDAAERRLRDLILLFLINNDKTMVLAVTDYYEHFYFPAVPGMEPDDFAERLQSKVRAVVANRNACSLLKIPNNLLSAMKPYNNNNNNRQYHTSDSDDDSSHHEPRSPLRSCTLVMKRSAWHYRTSDMPMYHLTFDCCSVAELFSFLLVCDAFLEDYLLPKHKEHLNSLRANNDLHTFYNQQCVPIHTKFLIDHNINLYNEADFFPDLLGSLETPNERFLESMYEHVYLISHTQLPQFLPAASQQFGLTVLFDIECFNDGGFPTSDKDPILCISAVFYLGSKEAPGAPWLVFVNGSACQTKAVERLAKDDAERIHYFECPDEKEMLQEFLRVYRAMQPNNLAGFNIVQFDLPYLIDRMKLHGIAPNFNGIDHCDGTGHPLVYRKIPQQNSKKPKSAPKPVSKKRQQKAQQVRQNLNQHNKKTKGTSSSSSSTTSTNGSSEEDEDDDDDDSNNNQLQTEAREKCNYLMTTLGVNVVDLLVVYQKFKSDLPMFNLDYISKRFLPANKQKLDLVDATERILKDAGSTFPTKFSHKAAYELIVILWGMDRPQDAEVPCAMRQLIVYYNVLDSVACGELAFNTREAFFSLCVALANITNLNLENVILTGQQRKIVTVFESFCVNSPIGGGETNFVLPYFRKDPELLRQLRNHVEEPKSSGETRFKNLVAELHRHQAAEYVFATNHDSFGKLKPAQQKALRELDRYLNNNPEWRARLRNKDVPSYAAECFVETTTASKKNKKGYEGAMVFDADSGYHDDPVITLDYQSLYPSIMRAHNLCYTTNISQQQAEALGLVKGRDYEVSPSGDMFVTHSVLTGVLPQQLTDGFNRRLVYKKAGFKAGDEATKTYINSVYGATGDNNYVTTKLPMVEIARSVTSYGQMYIKMTRKMIEEQGLNILTKADPEHQVVKLRIIYGDTDSVFIKVGLSTEYKKHLIETNQLRTKVDLWGTLLAAAITLTLPSPMKLVYEKFVWPMVLCTKKKYFGTSYVGSAPPSQCCKGMASKLRTYCPYVNRCCRDLEMLMVSDSFAGSDCAGRRSQIRSMVERQVSDLVKMCLDPTAEQLLDLLITKKHDSSKTYNSVKMPHLEVVRKRQARNALDVPNNERIAFVFLEPKGDALKYGLVADYYVQADDVGWIRHRLRLGNKVRLFGNFYVNNQLANALRLQLVPIFMDEEGYDTMLRDVVKSAARGSGHNNLYRFFGQS